MHNASINKGVIQSLSHLFRAKMKIGRFPRSKLFAIFLYARGGPGLSLIACSSLYCLCFFSPWSFVGVDLLSYLLSSLSNALSAVISSVSFLAPGMEGAPAAPTAVAAAALTSVAAAAAGTFLACCCCCTSLAGCCCVSLRSLSRCCCCCCCCRCCCCSLRCRWCCAWCSLLSRSGSLRAFSCRLRDSADEEGALLKRGRFENRPSLIDN